MSSNSDDIQAAGSNTRHPMLDRTDYESWSQRIWLYCRGKENGVYILQSIDQGPFQLGVTRDTLGTTLRGVFLDRKGSETYDDLKTMKRNIRCDVRTTTLCSGITPKNLQDDYGLTIQTKLQVINNMSLIGIDLSQRHIHQYAETSSLDMDTPNDEILDTLTKNCDTHQSSEQPHRPNPTYETSSNTEIKQLFRKVDRGSEGSSVINRNRIRVSFLGEMVQQVLEVHRIELGMLMQNEAVLDEEELLFLVGEQPNTFDADVDNQPVRDLARNEYNIFQADECDAFNSDVDDEPTAQSIFMANLSSVGPTNLQASSSDASILSEVPDLENANVASDNNQVKHKIHSEVQ
ncbi:hypothetical protein Tco_0549088 [Tanacetum coccineum]